jgi:hypothetical protein
VPEFAACDLSALSASTRCSAGAAALARGQIALREDKRGRPAADGGDADDLERQIEVLHQPSHTLSCW